jgi:hypothetical protein
MAASVVWSPDIRLAVKSLKEMKGKETISILRGQSVTTLELQAIQNQFLPKSKGDNFRCWWW